VVGGKPLPDRRHLVADRDGLDHDDDPCRVLPFRSRESTGLPFFGVVSRHRHEGRQVRRRRRRRRLPGLEATLAVDAPHHLGRRRALQENVLERRAPAHTSTGDGGAAATRTVYFWVVGRIDDVLQPSPAHRIGTAEIEGARLVSHPGVAEAAAVGRPDDLKGQALVVFVTLKPGWAPDDATRGQAHPAGRNRDRQIRADPTASASPTPLPKTRSGKIMRRLLKDGRRRQRCQGRYLDARGSLGDGRAACRRGVKG